MLLNECVVGRMDGRIEYPRLAAGKSSLEAFHFLPMRCLTLHDGI